MPSVLLIIAIAVPAVLLLLLWKYSYWYRLGIPQGNPLKLFGDLNDLGFATTPHFDNYVDLSRKFSGKPFFGVYSFTRPRLVIRDPEMAKEVLLKKFSSFSENGFELDRDMEPIMGRDPFFQTGERWKESRNFFTAVMTPSRLRSMSLQMDVVSKDAVHYLKNLKHESGIGEGTDVKEFAVRFMTNLLIRTTLSVDAECFTQEKDNVFMEAGKNVFEESLMSVFRGILIILAPRLGPYLGMQLVPKKTTTFFNNVVQSQKEYRAKNGITREDILDIMIKKMKPKNGSSAKDDSDLEVLAMVIMFFLEGYETTSTATSAALIELARNSELQEKIRGQILTLCPPGKEITEEALNNIPSLQDCFIESLRMYPPGLYFQRIVTNDVTLEARTGEQVSLNKGSYVNILIGGLNRDPEFFPDPDNYNPERFEDEAQKRIFLSFGDGPRQCPGQKFASLAGRTLLAMILREFKLELSPKTAYPLKPMNNPLLFTLTDVFVRFIPL